MNLISSGTNSDSRKIRTYLNLVKDIIVNYRSVSTVNDVENKYKLSRLTPKDITAQVLKKGHHGVKNTTSETFLFAVKPNKIVSTGSGKYTSSLINTLDYGVDFRVRMYYESMDSGSNEKSAFQEVYDAQAGNKKYGLQEHLHKSGTSYYKANWFYSVFVPSGIKSYSNYQYAIKLKTSTGNAWEGYDATADYIHDTFYYLNNICNTKKQD